MINGMKHIRNGEVFELEIDGKMVPYPIRTLPQAFIDWNIGQRVGFLHARLNPGTVPHGKFGFGAHLPICITNNAPGSLFPANAANKGTAPARTLTRRIRAFEAKELFQAGKDRADCLRKGVGGGGILARVHGGAVYRGCARRERDLRCCSSAVAMRRAGRCDTAGNRPHSKCCGRSPNRPPRRRAPMSPVHDA